MPRMTWAAAAALILWTSGAAAAEPASASLECLALNVYWEARAESAEDQLAVAHVTLNRVLDDGFPNTICAVVRQGGERPRHRCQFSWWCDGKSDRPTNAEAWARAREIARKAYSGSSSDPTGGALYFHNRSVRPVWTNGKARTATIGPHIFYR